MTPETLLLRQIHPLFVENERAGYLAFRPTPNDEHLLSVDNGDKISAENSWKRFTASLQSAGVLAVSNGECETESLPVLEDGIPYPEHCSVDFSGLSKSQIKTKAKVLWDKAITRGWQYQASET